ncbi:MAG: xylulose kinase, partial [Caldilineaceae bacterium]|nr:xylulose kinase [Caldilineaceae bacterium]
MSGSIRSEAPYVLAIDAGTEALKAALYDLHGVTVAASSRSYHTSFPHSGWAEQDPAAWWDAMVGAVRDCVEKAPINPTEILAISADATTCTLIPMRADGQALGRALLWMDVRAAEEAARIFASGHPALHYCLAGVNAEWMPPKICWLKAQEPARYAEMDYLLEFTDWIAYRLTGRFTLNRNTVTQRWFYHTPSGGWPSDFFATIGLADLLPKLPSSVLAAGEVVGPLHATVAAELGLPAGIPVVTGGGDAFIGILGQGVTQPGDLGMILGASNVLSALAATEFHVPGIFGSFPNALMDGLNLVEAGQVSTGAILAWFKRTFMAEAERDAQARGLAVYQLLDNEAAATPPGADGLIVLDYFQGNRTPHTDSLARGAVWGLSLNHTRGHIFRALMEGIAYGVQDILQTFRQQGFQVARIFASGGATRSPLFMQIYADVTGQTIYIPRD